MILDVPNEGRRIGPRGGLDYFCELLDFAAPWPGGLAVMLLAYCDGSERDGGIYSVGAVAFGVDRAKKATRRWQNLWGDTRCHMTELHTRKKGTAFEDWTSEQARERSIAMIPIINQTASFVVAVSCDLAEIDELKPASHGSSISAQVSYGGVSTPYALCCHVAMCSVADLVDEKTDIAYFFESGDVGQRASQRFIAGLAQYPVASRDLYKLRSHHVLDKNDSRLFEMSDIAAWEWAKHVERTRQGLHMRPSLSALLGDRLASDGPINLKSRTRRGWHLTGAPLATFYGRLKDRGVFDD